jgi:glycosyltransferase involved in cell wall biosynthesis
MKQVLCIAYLFPPHGGGGVQRTVKFVKYLARYGWQPTILTAPAQGPLLDPSLMADVPAQTPIMRVQGPMLPKSLPWRLRQWLTRWFLVIDEQVGWLPFAVRRGAALLRRESFQALYSTAGPYTDHLVALRLRRAGRVPWVADFRDPWLGNESASFPTPLHRSLNARLEGDVVMAADRVLVVSEPMRCQFLTRYPGLSPTRIVTLPNGFDPADFEGVEPAARDSRFTLVYTGSFYGSRSARHFLAALRQVLDAGLIPRRAICVRLIGNTGHEAARLVEEWGLHDVVEFAGYLSHQQTLAHQLAADLLLLIVGGGADSRVVLTAKIFEYLACARPILALVPPGAAADLLTEAGVGRIVPPDNQEAAATALAALFADWRSGRLQTLPDPFVVARYDRRLQAGELAHILDDIAPTNRWPSDK